MSEIEHGRDTTIFACPSCRGRLTTQADSLTCSGCEAEFPWMAPDLPILVGDTPAFLSGERQVLEHEAAQHSATGEYYLQVAESAGIRRETLRQLGQGLIHNGRLLGELREELPLSDVKIEQHGLALGADLFAALRKDWSGMEETEAEIRVASQAIIETLAQSPPSKTLVLGAGLGRTLCEIDAKFPGAVGLDLSTRMALAFDRLRVAGELTAYLLHQGNFLRAADECDTIQARRNLTEGNPQYVVADASQLPLLDDSFDAVVSNYFTDMLPLSMWLAEAKRVLKPTGRFIHFGPLGYAFPQIAEHYAVDQLPAAFEQYGLRLSEPRIVQNSFYGSANRLNRFALDNLLLEAWHVDHD